MTIESPQPVRGPRPVRSAIVLAATVAVVVTAAVAAGANPSTQPASPQATTSPGSTSAPGATMAPGQAGRPMGPFGFHGRDGWDGPRGFRGGFPGAIGAISIDSVDGTKVNLKTDDGWTRTIDTSGVTVTRAGKTITASDLSAGDRVVIEEQLYSDGTFTVTALRVLVPRIDGVVDAVTGATFTVKQRDGTSRTVTITDATTYTVGKNAGSKSDLKSGLEVDVEGTATGDTFTADAVHIAPSVLAGTVTAKQNGSLTITQRDGSTGTITVDSSTTWTVAGVSNPTIADVKVGDLVIAEGSLSSDGSLAATNVRAGIATFREGRPGPGSFSIPFGPGGGFFGHGHGFGGPGRGFGGGQGPGQNPNQPQPSPSTTSDSGTNG
jgi:hypothetical protein